MAILKEGKRDVAFIVSEANGYRSRGVGTVTAVTALSGGALLGKITASGKYVALNLTATNGSQTVAAILYEGVPAATELDRTLFLRNAEVTQADLVYPKGATAANILAINTALAALGIIVL